MLKCLGMNCYDICNLVLNGLEKVKKKKERKYRNLFGIFYSNYLLF